MVRHLVIDGDGHVEEDRERLTELLPEKMRGLAPHYETQPDGSQVQYVEGRPWSTDFAFPFGPQQHVMAGGEVRYGGKDPRVRLEVLDSEGIDVAVLYPSVGLMFGLYQDPEVAAAMCHAYNDWLAEYCAADPQRLVGVALLAQQNPESCAAELDRCVNELGFVGGMMRPNRIQGITVKVPPLRERRADVAPLVAQFVAHLSAYHDTSPPRLSRGAKDTLVGYAWPGNVRELRNTIEVLCLLRAGKQVRVRDLPEAFHQGAASPKNQEHRITADAALTIDLDESLKTIIERVIEARLAAEQGNRARAAERLGVSVRTIQRHLARGLGV